MFMVTCYFCDIVTVFIRIFSFHFGFIHFAVFILCVIFLNLYFYIALISFFSFIFKYFNLKYLTFVSLIFSCNFYIDKLF